MKKISLLKKLSLSRETLRQLDERETAQAAGGISALGQNSCSCHTFELACTGSRACDPTGTC